MQIGYEENYDILGIIIPDKKYKVKKTIELEEGFLIDVNGRNKIVQIEIHFVSERIKSTKNYIKNAKIQVFVENYEFSYNIIIDFNDGEKEIKKQVMK